MTEIVVELPADRRYLGTLTLKDDQGRVVAGPFPAFGKADNIPTEIRRKAPMKSRAPSLPGTARTFPRTVTEFPARWRFDR
jgi:hypothetical protein